MDDTQLQLLLEICLIIFFCLILYPLSMIYKCFQFNNSKCSSCSHGHHSTTCKILTEKVIQVPEEYEEEIDVPKGEYRKVQKTIQVKIQIGTHIVKVKKFKTITNLVPVTKYRSEFRYTTPSVTTYNTIDFRGNLISTQHSHPRMESVNVPYITNEYQTCQVEYEVEEEQPKYKTESKVIEVEEPIMKKVKQMKTRYVDQLGPLTDCNCERCKCEKCVVSNCYYICCFGIKVWIPLLLINVLTIIMCFHLKFWYLFVIFSFLILIISFTINRRLS